MDARLHKLNINGEVKTMDIHLSQRSMSRLEASLQPVPCVSLKHFHDYSEQNSDYLFWQTRIVAN